MQRQSGTYDELPTFEESYTDGFKIGLTWDRPWTPGGPWVATKRVSKNPLWSSFCAATAENNKNWLAGWRAGREKKTLTHRKDRKLGMDLCGKQPNNETGEYFRNNVWWWRPLADYCCEIAPQYNGISWHSNDGDGLSAEDSVKLADILQALINDGSTARYEQKRKEMLDAMPDESCDLCDGTGTRNDAIVRGECNTCAGTGAVRPFDTYYPFSVDNVQLFVNFLRDCGGFEIN